LLNDLKIPHITLLDLDRERFGGGWGRIAYALEQLIKISPDKTSLLIEGKTKIKLDDMKKWDVNDTERMQQWIDLLENNDIFFSAPLDMDFLMLEQYKDIYLSTLESDEGPRLMVLEKGRKKQKYIKDIEESEEDFSEYNERISDDIHKALKACGGRGDTYTLKQKKLMIWYTYFFLTRGKPSTHIEAISRMDMETLGKNAPLVLKRLINKAEEKLKGDNENVNC